MNFASVTWITSEREPLAGSLGHRAPLGHPNLPIGQFIKIGGLEADFSPK